MQIDNNYRQFDDKHLLNEILDFIIQRVIEEKYNFDELEEFLNYLKQNMTEQ